MHVALEIIVGPYFLPTNTDVSHHSVTFLRNLLLL
jgi:hypothetical protein